VILTPKYFQFGAQRHDERTVYRLIRASVLMVIVFSIGTFGYWFLSDGHTLLECMYMTVITLTTVGFSEVIQISGNPKLELFTIVLIFFGMGTVLYFVSALMTFILEGEMRDLIWSRRMEKKITKLSGHFILAGFGQTGAHVLPRLIEQGKKVVVIERELRENLQACVTKDAMYVLGDATEDNTLLKAGIKSAAGIIFSLGNDKDNLFGTITARGLNPNLVIIAKGEEQSSRQKFIMAGASKVIFPNEIGAAKMASEVIKI